MEENIIQIKKCHVCEKDCVWNPTTCSCENEKYLATMMDDLAITCDKNIESYDKETRTIQQILLERKQSAKRKISLFYLYFY